MELNETKKSYNLFVNVSNQANIFSLKNSDSVQLNSVFIFIHPYKLEQMELEELDISIKINENGTIQINEAFLEAIEIKPGLKALAIMQELD